MYGQYAANISYVFLPSNKSKGLLICLIITLRRKSSEYPNNQPPCSNPPVGSSSGPPGACITLSSVMKDRTIVFLIYFPLLKFPSPCFRQSLSQVHIGLAYLKGNWTKSFPCLCGASSYLNASMSWRF